MSKMSPTAPSADSALPRSLKNSFSNGDAVADAIDSTVTVAAPNASAAPVAYSQTQVQELVTLANELKSDLTQAVSDLNAAIAVINDMLASERTAKQRAT